VIEMLKLISRQWKVIQHAREQFVCRACEVITEPPASSHPMARGRGGPKLLAHILFAEYGLHLPLNRQSAVDQREGVDLDVSTLADWVGASAATLMPLVEAIRSHVFAAERIHADDTTMPVLAKGKTIPLPQERASTLAPEELRRRQLAALTGWVMAGARVQAVVLAFEDPHWADPTTLDVLGGMAERGARAPMFIMATARSEFRPPWGMRSHHGTISLPPLDRLQVREMVAELSARHALPREVAEGVAARTGGVPLFVEEVTRLLLERGGQGGIQSIPPTLQQSLMARLDRLGPAREVAQVGSVIGRGFSYGLLRAVAAMEDGPLQMALKRLAEADILLVEGLPPESDYRFKHALIQDAAYENLLKSRRQVLHRRVGEALLDNLTATAAAEPELMAHHFTQAGLTEAAIEWWGKAGQRSLESSALVEAVEQLTRAIIQIVTLPATSALRREEIKLQAALITLLCISKDMPRNKPRRLWSGHAC
jgi:predicted ATPase